MNNIVIKMADPELYYLIDEFCDEKDIPRLNPEWSKCVVAIDTKTEKVVGLVAVQMMTHTEPMIIDPQYQGKGLWEQMSEAMEGYLDMLAGSSGFPIGVYNQPTNAAAERICRLRGYEKSDKPLYYKIYDGSSLVTNKVPNNGNGITKE